MSRTGAAQGLPGSMPRARRGALLSCLIAVVAAAGAPALARPALAAAGALPPAPTAPPPVAAPAPRPVMPTTAAPAAGGGAPPLDVPGASGAAAGETAGADATSAGAAAAAAPSIDERHVPTLDTTVAESDHEAIRDAWGVQVRPVASRLSVFALRAGTGCPAAAATSTAGACPAVTVSELAVRRWVGRNLAWNGGLAFALGGGSDHGRLLDTYFGGGPVVGVSILLANWRHLAVAANPALSLVFFKGAGSSSTAYVADLTADLEAELHFGFVGVPALAVGLRSGLLFRLEHAGDATVWSMGVGGASSVRGLFEDLALRYYF